jgi:hypothetical protein
VHHDEGLLIDVIEVSGRGAEPLEGGPHEPAVDAVNLVHVQRDGGLHGLR